MACGWQNGKRGGGSAGEAGDLCGGEGDPEEGEVVDVAAEGLAPAAVVSDHGRGCATRDERTTVCRAVAEGAIDVDGLKTARGIVGGGDMVPVPILELGEGGPSVLSIERHIKFPVSPGIQSKRKDRTSRNRRAGTSIEAVALKTEEDAVAAVFLAENLVIVAGIAAPCGLDPSRNGEGGLEGGTAADVDAIDSGVRAADGSRAAEGTGGARGGSAEDSGWSAGRVRGG